MSKEFCYSVLMSVYRKERAEYFDEAIQSMLGQTIAPSEFVIVCDGPLTAELDKVIGHYEELHDSLFRIVRLPHNMGLGNALAEGITHCKNEWIARMDSDDFCLPNRIEMQYAALKRNPSLGLIGTNVVEFIGSVDHVVAKVILPETDEEIRRYYRRRCAFRHPSLLFKKDEVLKAGNYSSRYYLFEDMDLFGRMIAGGTIAYNVQECLTQVRVSEDFYQRRGGIRYLKAMGSVRMMLLRIGVTRPLDFIISLSGQALVCLMPNKVRSAFYRRFLRTR